MAGLAIVFLCLVASSTVLTISFQNEESESSPESKSDSYVDDDDDDIFDSRSYSSEKDISETVNEDDTSDDDDDFVDLGNELISVGKREKTFTFTAEMKRKVLDRHNNYRRQVSPSAANMDKLEWDDNLAAMANDYSKKCSWRRNPNLPKNYGQNQLHCGHINPVVAVNTWNYFRRYYDYDNNQCRYRSPFVCSLYKQLAWASANRVGCGASICRNRLMTICYYNARVNGDRPYLKGNPCGKCPNGCSSDQKLCNPGRGSGTSKALPQGGQKPSSQQDRMSEQKAIVDAHNSARRKVRPRAANMMQMKWDDTLAKKAEEYAKKCDWKHNPDSTAKGFGVVGENMYKTTGPFDAANAVEAWVNEKKDYNYEANTCKKGKMCGHYTQVVWAETTKVGCGKANCSNGSFTIFVCNYAKAGNWRGQKPYKKGRSCSKCPNGRKSCSNRLCM